MTFSLAANAEMLFVDEPVVRRVERIHDAGFAVEIWDWTRHDLAALRRTGAEFSSMTGYIEGDLTTEDGRAALLDGARRSLRAAQELDCPRLNLHGTGLDAHGLPVVPRWETSATDLIHAVGTLRRVAELGESHGRVFTLENLNRRTDHPGTPFATSEETATLVAAVDSKGLRMNLDLYHAQVDEGGLIDRMKAFHPLIGEIQVADAPGRCEPGTGEISYPAIARALAEQGYEGIVALEAWASEDADSALERFREAFTV